MITLLSTLLVAVVSGGTMSAIINAIQNRKKLTAEADDIYSRKRVRERSADRKERAYLKAEAKLMEYKVSLLTDACEAMLEQVQHCPGVDVRQVRAEVRRIKFLDRIPNQPSPEDLLNGDDV
ncbi:hypothetical protein K8O93_01285 [Gordonia bronchialis]|uniref:hypothetical protein n=1 Tax=Gordonia bronchialis TaxID=2054 RepID=UPI001CBB270C|nr:hypothetical protein [Gordonia bronchialis]UAK38468.1 hypothetical protein K8O93_01285 [Gordonia bronchialis]